MDFAYSTDEECRRQSQVVAQADMADTDMLDCLDAALLDLGDEAGEIVWTGKIIRKGAEHYAPDADVLIDHMQNQAYEEAEEWAENWLQGVPKDHKAELNLSIRDVIHAWADKHGYQPNFYQVTDIQAHVAGATNTVRQDDREGK